MSNYSFKTYKRGQRIQTSEGSFVHGEYFTRAPLTEGKVRLLVNYDLINDGDSLTNRKGLRTSEVALPFSQSGLNPSITSDLSITQAKDVVEEDNKHYCLIVANQFSHNAVIDSSSGLYSAPAELWVVKQDSTTYPCLNEYDITCKNMYALPLSYEMPLEYDSTETYNTGDKCIYQNNPYKCLADNVTGTWDSTKWTTYIYPKSYYRIPNNTVVHDININAIENLARPIGCFAFQDNDYYNFNTDGELIRSAYMPADTESQTTETYIVEKLDPKGLTASEAVSCGFNMLSEHPFTFEDRIRQGTIYFDGILPLDENGDVVTEPLKNIPYTFRCFYQGEVGKSYKLVWKYKEVGTDVYTKFDLENDIFTITDPLTEMSITNSFGFDNIIISIAAYAESSTPGTYNEYPEKTQEVSIEFAKSKTKNTNSLINYDLSKAKGMCYWKNRLWLYGLAQGPTILFASEINEPTYFPYPNNIDIFDEPILNCTPFNDTLLVFTKTSVHQLSLNTDGSWSNKTLQSNLDFTEQDSNLVQIVKNMVYFKSGDYYYMIVPKSLSLQNELAIAPVSKNIEYFLDEFEKNVKDVISTLYDYEEELTLVNHYNYLNYEDVSNVYVFKTNNSTLLINVVLLYNTVDRTWRTYVCESQDNVFPFNMDATKVCTMMAPLYAKLNIGGVQIQTVGIQFIDVARTNVRDFYIPKNSIFNYSNNTWQADNGVIETAFNTLHLYKNYQILDTGYRDQAVDYNKRYRELQLKFNNVDMSYIKFSTDFIIDGETRINHFRYSTEQYIDPTDPTHFGHLYISRTPIENIELPGGTSLGINNQDINAWALDNSRFPEIAYWKARLKVSGKGYTPRFMLASRTEERYELLGYTWVYRQMYSR